MAALDEVPERRATVLTYPHLLSLEARVLLLSLSSSSLAELAVAISDERLEWKRLLWLIDKERAAPAIQAAIQALPADTVPAGDLAALRRLGAVSDFRMLHLETLLGDVLDQLAAARIDVVLLKGAALATTVYGSFRSRPMYDLDLLVRPEDGRRAWEALRAAGWRHDEVECPVDFYTGHHHLPPLDDPAGTGLAIELHTSLGAGAAKLSVQRVFNDARTAEFRGRSVRVPAVEHQMVHLATHFAWSHVLRSSGWRTFRDLQHLIDTGEVAWDSLINTAREVGAERSLYWTLRLGRRLVGVGAPDRVLRELEPSLPDWILDLLERHFVAGVFAYGPISCPSLSLARMLWTTGMMGEGDRNGTTRPWSRDQEFAGVTGSRSRPDVRERLRAQVRKLAMWRSYLRGLLTSPGDVALRNPKRIHSSGRLGAGSCPVGRGDAAGPCDRPAPRVSTSTSTPTQRSTRS